MIMICLTKSHFCDQVNYNTIRKTSSKNLQWTVPTCDVIIHCTLLPHFHAACYNYVLNPLPIYLTPSSMFKLVFIFIFISPPFYCRRRRPRFWSIRREVTILWNRSILGKSKSQIYFHLGACPSKLELDLYLLLHTH